MADVFYRCTLGLLFFVLINYGEFLLPVTKAELHPAPDFSRHTLVKPRIYHGREKRQISTTKEEDGKHINQLTISYDVEGKEYILDLQLNRNLIPKGYFRRHQENRNKVINRPNEEDIDFCHYHGKIKGIPTSWAAISTCEDDGISGMVFDGTEVHYIEKPNDRSLDNEHYFYKHTDLVPNNKSCGYGNHDHTTIHHPVNNRILRYKRGTDSQSTLKGPYNANRQSRYVELILVVDNAEFKEMGENHRKVEHHCQQIANIINALYAPLNIFVALVGIVIWSERDELTFSTNGDTTLTNFLHYRKDQLIKEHPNDNAQLLTKFSFEHGVVGKALKGPICTIEYSGGVNTDHSPIIGLVATTVAHEMGHNFGMEHDTNECICPEERCIMAPSSSSTPPTHWSSCSLEYLALAFEHGMDYCLRNKPQALFASPVCGNGFVEPGEQCDCGLLNRCDNTCCNATTCMLYSNATCATGECCDLKTCRPKSASTLCRSADYECDLPEYCTGQSEYCPVDIYKMDTETCDGGKAYCYQGFCRTRSDQCKLLWGETGKSSDDQCYLLNTKGSRHGNCGYNKLNQSYFKCKDEDIFCGMLHCKHLNERLEFGMESVAILSHSFINVKGSVVPCRAALVDLGINQIDPGLAPDGAKCGESKMCVNQKCMPIGNLRTADKTCTNNCNGNGICNSLGHCHCKDGFAPPFCDHPGFGGSEDSGPTSDPDGRKDFITALFVIFLGILPALAIIGFLMYYTRHNLKLTWKKSSPSKSSQSKPRGLGSFQPSQAPRRSEDIHSLLHEDQTATHALKKEFFGNFKGFSISPLKTQGQEPIRSAPPLPIPHPVTKTPIVNRASGMTADVVRSNSTKLNDAESPIPPALPPLNPGANPRPIISSPILENSTCTAKELLSPLKHVPKIPVRPAPARPLSSPDTMTISTIIPDVKPIKESNSALNRIASFLKTDKKSQSAMPKNSVKATKVLDKNSLRTIEISNPIPQASIAPANVTESKPVVMRAQSMRGGAVTQRPNIPNFGSMRNPSGNKRPISIPAANRPKSPPPPRPSLPDLQDESKPSVVRIPTIPGYHKPQSADVESLNQYDDCLNEATKLVKIKEEKESSPISDNIYAVIDETPNNSVVCSPENSISSDSAGLLSEIVSEIQIRNGDSIYSTSTLSRRKQEDAKTDGASEIYENTSSMYKVPESIYSNMNQNKSSASSVSSAYINPSMVNPPIKPVNIKPISGQVAKLNNPRPSLSTFKADPKPETSTQKPSPLQKGPTASSYKPNHIVTNKDVIKVSKVTPPSPKTSKVLNRQTTPPNLRVRRPSPTRAAPNTSNSPDLVMSCSANENGVKSPDVLNNSAPAILKKPNLPKSVPKVSKPIITLKNAADKKVTNGDTKPFVLTKVSKTPNETNNKSSVIAASAKRQNSNVAALQQKFENKLPLTATKGVALKNK